MPLRVPANVILINMLCFTVSPSVEPQPILPETPKGALRSLLAIKFTPVFSVFNSQPKKKLTLCFVPIDERIIEMIFKSFVWNKLSDGVSIMTILDYAFICSAN